MKKLFAFILITLYSVTSFGMTLHLHYCCGKVDKVTLSAEAVTSCKFNTEIHTRSCCDSKEYQLKIKIDQEASSQQIISFSPQVLISFPCYSSRLFLPHKILVNPLSTGPPIFPSTTPLFIQYCIYRL